MSIVLACAFALTGLLAITPAAEAHHGPCGTDMALMMDTSGSMGIGSRMTVLKDLGHGLLDGMAPGDNSALVSYSHIATIEQGLSDDHDATRAALDALTAGGGTNAAAGYQKVADVLGVGASEQQAVVHVTDGVSGGDPAAEAEKLRRAGVEVFGVLLQGGDAAQMRQQVSEPVADHLFYVNSSADAAAVAAAISAGVGSARCPLAWVSGPCDRDLQVGAPRGNIRLSAQATAGGAEVAIHTNSTLPSGTLTVANGTVGLSWTPRMPDRGLYNVALYAHAADAVATCAFTLEVLRCIDVPAACEDTDADGVPDASDNCIATVNDDQADLDRDGAGDACDDSDGDGILDGDDNCHVTANAGQEDLDGDGLGDACDDADHDGVMDATDNCRTAYNPHQGDFDVDGIGDACEDSDGDGVLDADDNCPGTHQGSQADGDGDGIGDACDDSDGDGVMDDRDNCRETHNPGQDDLDGDGQGDACQPVLELLY